ncbi:putative deoxycytidylate deaminase [Cyclospora cayetanensis]|uniref:dCMP deaminase n=1 Tax=Cyclospora cayetanensis TaxID=88456 RepID=A0A1D3D9Z3_9EIME|nr:putative deoxycytidylate deaminase [Cyclospora cayetanensis]
MVVVGIVGPQQSGKKTVAATLQKLHGFKILTIGGNTPQGVFVHGGTKKEVEEASNTPDARLSAAPTAETTPATTPGAREAVAPYEESKATEAATAVMDYCMQHWGEDFLVLGFRTLEQVKVFRKRPIFLLLAVDAPLLCRLRRSGTQDVSAFLAHEDRLMFGSDAEKESHGIYACMRQADAIVLGDRDLASLEKKLSALDIVNPERRRPSWDAYFMRLASLAASRANCLKRRELCARRFIGLVLSSDLASTRAASFLQPLVSTGYNGTHSAAVNCLDGGCERCSDPTVHAGRQLEACSCIHAEANALLEAGRERCLGGAIYVTLLPCLSCAKLTIQAGIKRVVYAEAYDTQSGSLELLRNAGLEVYRFSDRHPSIPHAIVSFAE